MIEIAPGKEVAWQYGGSMGNHPGQLSGPRFAQRGPGVTTVITDTGNHRVIGVDRRGQALWQFGDSYIRGPEHLWYPHQAVLTGPSFNTSNDHVRQSAPKWSLNDAKYSCALIRPLSLWAFTVLLVIGLA